MKKILHITQFYNPHIGGIESTAEDIANILKSTGEYNQLVFCFGKEDDSLIDGINVIRCKPLIKVRSQCISFKYTKMLKRIINNFNPDIILLHFPNPFTARSILKCHYKGKIIIYHHLDIVKQKILKFFVKPYLNKVYDKAYKIIATSQNYVDYSDELKKHKDKINIIPSTYSDEKINLNYDDIDQIKELKNNYKYPIGIFMGRHVGYKGLEYAIEAVKDIKDFTFLIGGSGPLTNTLKKQAKGCDNIKFIGSLSTKNYKIYLNMADFFIFPSIRRNEAFGLSLLEAMACGKPAITFTIKGSAVNWINLNNITGIECKNKDVNELRDAINKLKDNDDLRSKLGENARKRAHELFSPKIFKENIINFFKKL